MKTVKLTKVLRETNSHIGLFHSLGTQIAEASNADAVRELQESREDVIKYIYNCREKLILIKNGMNAKERKLVDEILLTINLAMRNDV